MPFTLSHAAAVLPGIRGDGTGRGPLIASALVAGSLAPDLTYYAASGVSGAMAFGDFTHSPTGVLTVDAALTALLVGVWLLLREPLVALLPRARQGRAYAVLRGRSWRGRPPLALAGALYLSAVVGAGTHIFLDGFTHHDGWATPALPVLTESFAGSPLFWYAQYGGSLVLAVVIGTFLVSSLRRAEPADLSPVPLLSRRDRTLAAVFVGLCATLAAVHRVARWWAEWNETAEPYEIIPSACFGAGAGLAVALPMYAVAVRLRRPAAAAPDPHPADAVRPSS